MKFRVVNHEPASSRITVHTRAVFSLEYRHQVCRFLEAVRETVRCVDCRNFRAKYRDLWITSSNWHGESRNFCIVLILCLMLYAYLFYCN